MVCVMFTTVLKYVNIYIYNKVLIEYAKMKVVCNYERGCFLRCYITFTINTYTSIYRLFLKTKNALKMFLQSEKILKDTIHQNISDGAPGWLGQLSICPRLRL